VAGGLEEIVFCATIHATHSLSKNDAEQCGEAVIEWGKAIGFLVS
jgi:hypothetical protein